MKEPTIFDVIGPIMVGPSSSHTAGALRISLMVYRILKEHKITEVEFQLFNSFAKTYRGHGTDKALLGGILGYGSSDLRIRNSFEDADKAGLKYKFVVDGSLNNYHPNTVRILAKCEDGYEINVRGESIGGGMSVIRCINGVDIKLTGELNTILVAQYDKPGVLAYITNCLNNYNVNIAFLKLYREKKGEKAYTIIETDDEINGRILDAIKNGNNIKSAILIEV